MYKLMSYPGWPKKLIEENQPDIRPSGSRQYKLFSDYKIFITENDGEVYELCVPAGFKHDGASVPRFIWSTSGLTPDGLIRAGALVHDFLYRKRGNILVGYGPDLAKPVNISRKDADKIFLDLMLATGLWFYRARVAYWGVRLFGPRW